MIDIDADLIVFQELWHRDCLDDVLSVSELSNYQPTYIGPQWCNIAVALIVRSPWPVVSNDVIKQFPFTKLVKVDEGDELKITTDKFSRSIITVKIKHQTDRNTPLYIVYVSPEIQASVTSF